VKQMVMGAVIAFVLTGCATNPSVPRAVQLRQDVITAIDAMDVLARGVEAAVNAKVLTANQANDVWDIEKAAIRVLKATNQNAYAVLAQALVELEKLPFAEKIRPYISVARLSLAALSPPPQRVAMLAPRLRSESDSAHLSCTTPCLIGAF
jgi:starvation-inducible outer membrane lipoprotein